MELTKVISNVRHGVCFFASFIFTACALAADFIALVRFSGINSRYMLLVSSFPSMRYSSKKLLWNQKQMKNILWNHLHFKNIVKHNREPPWAETAWTLNINWVTEHFAFCSPTQMYVQSLIAKEIPKIYVSFKYSNYADWVAQFVENKTSKWYWCRPAFQPGKPITFRYLTSLLRKGFHWISQ